MNDYTTVLNKPPPSTSFNIALGGNPAIYSLEHGPVDGCVGEEEGRRGEEMKGITTCNPPVGVVRLLLPLTVHTEEKRHTTSY